MYIISRDQGGHNWEKQNLVTIMDRKGHYDIYKCSKCGMQAKSDTISTIKLKGSYSIENVYNCKGDNSINELNRIRITNCTAQGKSFENLKPNTEHSIITPPEGYKNDHTGVWVMGVGEPVKILTSEFIKL